MTIQISYAKVLFDNYGNADQVFKDYLLVEVNDRHRPDLEQSKRCHSMNLFIKTISKIKQLQI